MRLSLLLTASLAVGCGNPAETARSESAQQIIHVLNRHYVNRNDFAADLRAGDETLSDEEIDRRYEKFLDEIEALQIEQVELLRGLIREHDLSAIYVEGLTAENVESYRELAAAIRRFESNKPSNDSPIDQLLREQHRLDLLEMGAAGRLLISGELQDVLPCEDAEAFQLANPVRDDETVQYDQQAIERREDAIVRSLLAGGRVAIVILGSDHDLSENVARISGGTVEYFRVSGFGGR